MRLWSRTEEVRMIHRSHMEADTAYVRAPGDGAPFSTRSKRAHSLPVLGILSNPAFSKMTIVSSSHSSSSESVWDPPPFMPRDEYFPVTRKSPQHFTADPTRLRDGSGFCREANRTIRRRFARASA